MPSPSLARILILGNVLDLPWLARATAIASEANVPLAHVLTRWRLLPAADLARTLSQALLLPIYDVGSFQGPLPVAIPRHLCHRLRVLPLALSFLSGGGPGVLTLAMADPTDDDAADQIAGPLRVQLQRWLVDDDALERALRRFFPAEAAAGDVVIGTALAHAPANAQLDQLPTVPTVPSFAQLAQAAQQPQPPTAPTVPSYVKLAPPVAPAPPQQPGPITGVFARAAPPSTTKPPPPPPPQRVPLTADPDLPVARAESTSVSIAVLVGTPSSLETKHVSDAPPEMFVEQTEPKARPVPQPVDVDADATAPQRFGKPRPISPLSSGTATSQTPTPPLPPPLPPGSSEERVEGVFANETVEQLRSQQGPSSRELADLANATALDLARPKAVPPPLDDEPVPIEELRDELFDDIDAASSGEGAEGTEKESASFNPDETVENFRQAPAGRPRAAPTLRVLAVVDDAPSAAAASAALLGRVQELVCTPLANALDEVQRSAFDVVIVIDPPTGAAAAWQLAALAQRVTTRERKMTVISDVPDHDAIDGVQRHIPPTNGREIVRLVARVVTEQAAQQQQQQQQQARSGS